MIGIVALAVAVGFPLQPQLLQIAESVAADGKPNCVSYGADATIGPCLPLFAVKAGAQINALSLNGVITFTHAATVRLTQDEFALLSGHEIAHFYLGHNSSSISNELAADRLGAELACKAGYNPAAGASLFRYLAAGKLHPRRSDRTALVQSIPCFRPYLASGHTLLPVSVCRGKIAIDRQRQILCR